MNQNILKARQGQTALSWLHAQVKQLSKEALEMTEAQILEARKAFVAKIKKDDEHRELWAKTSLKAHWTGPLRGFASDGLNVRWNDFLDGWKAAKQGGAS
mgnify:CR=1 FL=1